MQETWVQSLGQENSLEKETATHSNSIAWEIPWTEEPGGLQSMEWQRVGDDWVTNTFTYHLYLNCHKYSSCFAYLYAILLPFQWLVTFCCLCQKQHKHSLGCLFIFILPFYIYVCKYSVIHVKILTESLNVSSGLFLLDIPLQREAGLLAHLRLFWNIILQKDCTLLVRKELINLRHISSCYLFFEILVSKVL